MTDKILLRNPQVIYIEVFKLFLIIFAVIHNRINMSVILQMREKCKKHLINESVLTDVVHFSHISVTQPRERQQLTKTIKMNKINIFCNLFNALRMLSIKS